MAKHIHFIGDTGKENEHMVPVRDIPKASTCISTGRGETVGMSSMSLPVEEDILNSSWLCDCIYNLYTAGRTLEDTFLWEQKQWGGAWPTLKGWASNVGQLHRGYIKHLVLIQL